MLFDDAEPQPADFEPRGGKPYIWPSWLSGLVLGDKSCQWAAWVKAHFYYKKRPQENENALVEWKIRHQGMVRDRAAVLRSQGLRVSVEDQNKFTYKGRVAIVGGKPDIVAIDDAGALISDAKSGRESDADVVQVAVYAMLWPRVKEFDGAVRGEIVYRDRVRELPFSVLEPLFVPIRAQVETTAAAAEPERSPSYAECSRCDIAACKDRVVDRTADEAPTDVDGEEVF